MMFWARGGAEGCARADRDNDRIKRTRGHAKREQDAETGGMEKDRESRIAWK